MERKTEEEHTIEEILNKTETDYDDKLKKEFLLTKEDLQFLHDSDSK